MNSVLAFSQFGTVFVFLYFVFLGLTVYMMVLFIKVARRGIAALDIYINKNNRGNDEGSKDIALEKEN